MRRIRTWAAVMALVGQIAFGAPAWARAEAPAVDSATRAEALDRFRRGVNLYDEGDTGGALAELLRAYQLAPNFKILYNLAQVSYQSRDYAAALGYFRRYLIDGGDQVPEIRRREVEGEIRALKRRTGHIDVQVPETGSEIAMDDVPAGPSPLSSPLLASVGRHRVDVTSPAGQRRSRVVEVVGDETVSVRFEPVLVTPPLRTPALGAPGADLATVPRAVVNDSPSPLVRRTPWLAWTATAALAIGAGITGGLALRRSRQAQDSLNSFPISKTNLDDLRSEQHSLALACDGLLLGALVMAGVSLYLGTSRTSEDASSSSPQAPPPLARAEP